MLEVAFHSDRENRGSLYLDAQRMRGLTHLVPSVISVIHRSRPDRDRVQRFIEETYARCYGSVISRHYPMLMSVEDGDGRIVAAVGLRAAAEETLFLEQYLSEPVELSLCKATGARVERETIFEIGNLAASGKGASVFLFVTLAAYLRQREGVYAVVTATDVLRNVFDFLRFNPLELGKADPHVLPDDGISWGNYYERDPKVLAGAIAPCFARLERYLPAHCNTDLGRLFAHIYTSEAAG